MMHDFAITERHVVFLDMPVVYDFALIGHRPFPARWKPENGARVGVMPRDASRAVEWLDVELGYVFHTLNAYDDGDRVVLDLVRHPKMFDRDVYGVADGRGTLQRWTIDPGARRVREEQVSERVQEFPRVDPRRLGRHHRYGYTTLTSDTGRGQRLGFGSLVKHDLRTGHAEVARLGAAAAASEAIFVPASEQAGEDEGWVLAVVYDARRDGSDLVVLDATNFTGRPVARVRLPQRVPFGFHGIWLPSSR
jgi:carotenoid cleavage oxygenase